MAQPINIGMDFGSLGIRAVYSAGAQPIIIPEDEKDSLLERWLWCEPSRTSGIGIAFPGIKSKIGSGQKITLNGNIWTPDELIADELRALKSRIEAQALQQVGQAAISVPANYSASRRAALRDAALKAGFTDAHLLNDSMAAVMFFADQSRQAATLMVYSMGYAGFEIGLVRAARGRYRTLGYEAGNAPCGAAFDELILRSCLTWFLDQKLVGNPPQWDAAQWMQMRLVAQQVKEGVSQADVVHLPIQASRPDSLHPFVVSFPRAEWEETITPAIDATLGQAEKVLMEANLVAQDLDAILLVGGSGRIPLVPAMIEKRFGKRPVALGAEMLARGAALYAMRLDASSLTTAPLGEVVEGLAERMEIPAAESAKVVTVTTAATSPTQFQSGMWLPAVKLPERRIPPASPQQDMGAVARDMVLKHISLLIEQSELHQAVAFAQKLLDDVQKLFDAAQSGWLPVSQSAAVVSAPVAEQSASGSRDHPLPNSTQTTNRRIADRVISRAYQLLRGGKHDEAVQQSHRAWELIPDSPEIFDKMLDIHYQAGMAKTDIGSYEQSCRWLQCAHSHDQSNTKIREALAERHYLQAKQLADSGRRDEARAAVEQCLYWAPEHEKGNELSGTLNKLKP